MIKMHTLVLGPLQANCYILHEADSKTCCVIDPGDSPARVLTWVSDLGLKIDSILLTHGHLDQVGAAKAISEATGCQLWMHQGDYSMASTPMNNYLYPLHDTAFPMVDFCEDGQQLSAGGLTFTVLSTPGHSWGSVCYLCGEHLFTGDTLFAGGCGRTDLSGGDWATILHSLNRLAAIEADLLVHPGHGESTTLAEEKQYNPYLR